VKQGLVLGKFMPLHRGHIGLIDFATTKCDELVVLLCSDKSERINGSLRYKWLIETFKNRPEITVVHLEYDPAVLPNTSVSSRDTSGLWADKIKKILPGLDIIIGSEPYIEFVAGCLGIEYAIYDTGRSISPARGENIMAAPFANWELISEAARPYFVKKVCLCGTESTGKTILCERLAKHFNTVFVCA
jgi:HTH-type transcriptional regulator, transcriptional repressor of NAD biosynthesis genes